MGLDMSYQAIPADCALIERARADQGLGELLCSVPNRFRHGPERGTFAADVEMEQMLLDLRRQHPGVETRNWFPERTEWDVIHYLLSANRRDAEGSEVDAWFDKAVRGSVEIADHVGGCMYVTPVEVKVIASLLEPMTATDLKVHYAPEKIESASVYKFWAEGNRSSEWVDECFAAFRTFYLDAAKYGEGALVCLT